MEDGLFKTGILLMALCSILRMCSNDDYKQVAKWWAFTVMGIFTAGIVLLFVATMMMIWNA
jgi:hypothetical protein